MNVTDQRAYLEALEIPLWVRTELVRQISNSVTQDFVPPGLSLGPGSSQVLLVCSGIDEPAKRVSADIVRCLSAEPVWAWPVTDIDSPSLKGQALENQIEEHLFTSVILFGEALNAQLFGGPVPDILGSARISTAASLGELEASPASRQELWKLINDCHIVG